MANFDDDTMPASTIRAWVLGILGAIVLPGVNQFFYLRYPGIVVGSVRLLPLTAIALRVLTHLLLYSLSRNWSFSR